MPLHHTVDGVDGVGGISQASADADAEAEMEERLAICTVEGGLSEAEARTIAEDHRNDTGSERI